MIRAAPTEAWRRRASGSARHMSFGEMEWRYERDRAGARRRERTMGMGRRIPLCVVESIQSACWVRVVPLELPDHHRRGRWGCRSPWVHRDLTLRPLRTDRASWEWAPTAAVPMHERASRGPSAAAGVPPCGRSSGPFSRRAGGGPGGGSSGGVERVVPPLCASPAGRVEQADDAFQPVGDGVCGVHGFRRPARLCTARYRVAPALPVIGAGGTRRLVSVGSRAWGPGRPDIRTARTTLRCAGLPCPSVGSRRRPGPRRRRGVRRRA